MNKYFCIKYTRNIERVCEKYIFVIYVYIELSNEYYVAEKRCDYGVVEWGKGERTFFSF